MNKLIDPRESFDSFAADEINKQDWDFFYRIINSAADPIFVKNRKHCWVLLNDAFCSFAGRNRSELLGKTDYDFFPRAEAEVFWQKDKEVFESGIENFSEESLTDAKGVTHILHTKKTLYRNGQGQKFIVGVIRDITDLKRAEEALIRSEAELRRSNLELEQFGQLVSHDLQAPLTNILSLEEVLAESVEKKLTEEEKDLFTRLHSNAERMSELIRDLLEYARAGRKKPEMEMIHLNEIVLEVVENLRSQIGQSGAKITLGNLPTVKADPVQMRLLFQNLIGNSLKYRQPGKPALITLEGGVAAEGIVEVSVRDNGIGFDPKHAEKIFEPFTRLVGQHEFEGTGIGLATCCKIVTRHNGRIFAQSSPGSGSTFTVQLPSSNGGRRL